MEFLDIMVTVKGEKVPVKVNKYTTYLELAKKFQKYYDSQILVVNVDNKLKTLNKKIEVSGNVEFFDITSSYGFKCYQKSAGLLMICAAKEVLGDDTQIYMEHTINDNYFGRFINREVTESEIQQIEDRMKELVEDDLAYEKIYMRLEEAISIMKEQKMEEKAEFLKYYKESRIGLYKLGNWFDFLYGPLVPSTSFIKKFRLSMHHNGFILQFASFKKPDELLKITDTPKIFQIFDEFSNWGRILNIDTIGKLNKVVCDGKLDDMILISEALQEKKIAYIADQIWQRKTPIVLIAGPSSSGKTTFSERLGVQLKVSGLRPYRLSIDDYYLDRDQIPYGPDGKQDLESLEAIDTELFNKDLSRLLNGECVEIPSFNFAIGKKEYKGRKICLKKNDVLVIEGIHGLNERLTASVPKKDKFKIYISALTQLNMDEHNLVSTTDSRLIRRIVRDNAFRNYDAKKTIEIWSSVTRGERENIFPYQEEADVMFNSALVYELLVLKTFAEPLLLKVEMDCPEYVEAQRLITFLKGIVSAPLPDVPYNSILREFIGGSCFKVH